MKYLLFYWSNYKGLRVVIYRFNLNGAPTPRCKRQGKPDRAGNAYRVIHVRLVTFNALIADESTAMQRRSAHPQSMSARIF